MILKIPANAPISAFSQHKSQSVESGVIDNPRDMPWSPVTNWQNPALDVGVGFSLWERRTTTSRAG